MTTRWSAGEQGEEDGVYVDRGGGSLRPTDPPVGPGVPQAPEGHQGMLIHSHTSIRSRLLLASLMTK